MVQSLSSEQPQPTYAAAVPDSVLTPDVVETAQLGTLRFFDGMPDMGTMNKNADGSVTLFVGPEPPAGQEANWLPTAGKRPLPMFRFFGATDALFDKTFKLPDFELVEP